MQLISHGNHIFSYSPVSEDSACLADEHRHPLDLLRVEPKGGEVLLGGSDALRPSQHYFSDDAIKRFDNIRE